MLQVMGPVQPERLVHLVEVGQCGGGAVGGSVVSGGSWADSYIYSTVVCDKTDGDRVLASSMSSTEKSKTKKSSK